MCFWLILSSLSDKNKCEMHLARRRRTRGCFYVPVVHVSVHKVTFRKGSTAEELCIPPTRTQPAPQNQVPTPCWRLHACWCTCGVLDEDAGESGTGGAAHPDSDPRLSNVELQPSRLQGRLQGLRRISHAQKQAATVPFEFSSPPPPTQLLRSSAFSFLLLTALSCP